MDTALIRHAFLLGVAVAAPVGPISLLVIRRSLSRGLTCGFVSGLGAASADALYALVGAFGTALAAELTAHGSILQAVGGVIMCWLGLRTWQAPAPDRTVAGEGRMHHLRAFSSTLVLTLASPTTILSFAGVSAGLGLGAAGTDRSAIPVLVISVFLGSTVWWILLSGGVAFLAERLSPRVLRTVNRVSGALLIGGGVLALVHPR